jgi:hypothetical protein
MRATPSRERISVIGARLAFMLLVVVPLAGAIVGGLLRAGVAVPVPAASAWPGQVVLAHAFLMICGFLGTAIGVERAVAAKARAAFAAPIASGLAGIAALNGALPLAAWLSVFAALAFVLVNVSMLMRQKLPHIGVLLAGAAAWWVGSLLFALGGAARSAAAVPWWFSFLILTIAGERLEMTRLLCRRAGATGSLYIVLGSMLAGSALFAAWPAAGALIFGAALLALALWLACFDVARRTLASHGLSRYMAVCLLIGYAWLGIAGVAWIAAAQHHPLRDLALHALGIGFVFSMMLAHAPVILPALTRIKVHFGGYFYLPLALLHASLAIRMLASLDLAFLRAGAFGNAVAITAFLFTLLVSAVAWRLKHPPRPHAVPAHD